MDLRDERSSSLKNDTDGSKLTEDTLLDISVDHIQFLPIMPYFAIYSV